MLYKEYKVVTGQLENKFKSQQSCWDVTKRVNRQKENNKVLKKQVTVARNKISDLEKENDGLNKRLDSALGTLPTLGKSVRIK